MENHNILNDFLKESKIKFGGCALYESSDKHYYLATIANTSTGPLFLLNDRFFYDYTQTYEKTKPWKLIYVKYI